eukprot:359768-Chlamydomonas_euryale.AAC.6
MLLATGQPAPARPAAVAASGQLPIDSGGPLQWAPPRYAGASIAGMQGFCALCSCARHAAVDAAVAAVALAAAAARRGPEPCATRAAGTRRVARWGALPAPARRAARPRVPHARRRRRRVAWGRPAAWVTGCGSAVRPKCRAAGAAAAVSAAAGDAAGAAARGCGCGTVVAGRRALTNAAACGGETLGRAAVVAIPLFPRTDGSVVHIQAVAGHRTRALTELDKSRGTSGGRSV